MNKLITILSALSIAFSAAASDFTTVIRTVLDANPELKSRQQELQTQQLEAADANSLPNPEAGITKLWGANGAGNKFEFEISQSFDWPGLYSARSNAARTGLEASQMLYLSSRLELALQVKQKLNELVYLNQQLDLLETIKKNTNQVQERVELGYRGGELTILDSKKMQMEQYEIDNEIASVSDAIFRLKTDIQALCPEQELDLQEFDAYDLEPVLTADEYFEQIAALDPVISAGRLSAEQETLNAKAAQAQRFPGFTVGYNFMNELGDKFNGFSVSVSLPFFQNRKARAAALSRAESARMANESAIAVRRAEIATSLNELNSQKSRIEEYQRVFGDNAYLALLLQAYNGGQINVIEYLIEVNYYNETSRACLTARYQYAQSLASLNRYNLMITPR